MWKTYNNKFAFHSEEVILPCPISNKRKCTNAVSLDIAKHELPRFLQKKLTLKKRSECHKSIETNFRLKKLFLTKSEMSLGKNYFVQFSLVICHTFDQMKLAQMYSKKTPLITLSQTKSDFINRTITSNFY